MTRSRAAEAAGAGAEAFTEAACGPEVSMEAECVPVPSMADDMPSRDAATRGAAIAWQVALVRATPSRAVRVVRVTRAIRSQVCQGAPVTQVARATAEAGAGIIRGAPEPQSPERPRSARMALTTATTTITAAIRTRTADGSAQINMGINTSIDDARLNLEESGRAANTMHS